jgi:hypothetical protein
LIFYREKRKVNSKFLFRARKDREKLEKANLVKNFNTKIRTFFDSKKWRS